jgi:hypothetical protein
VKWPDCDSYLGTLECMPMKPPHSRRIFAFFLGTVGILLAAYYLYGRLFDGDIRQYQISPDGKNIAEWREYHQSSATTTDLTTVELRSRLNPFRHTVLAGLDYGADLSVSWIDQRNLLIRCTKCTSFDIKCDICGGPLYVVGKDTTWRDISVHYATK